MNKSIIVVLLFALLMASCKLNDPISGNLNPNTPDFYECNIHSIKYVEGNVIGSITEYSLSPNGALIEEYSATIAFDSADHETNEILQESGNSLNDTPAELDWKRLSAYSPTLIPLASILMFVQDGI